MPLMLLVSRRNRTTRRRTVSNTCRIPSWPRHFGYDQWFEKSSYVTDSVSFYGHCHFPQRENITRNRVTLGRMETLLKCQSHTTLVKDS